MLLPFIIAGLTTGSVYALAGVGLVLTYKTSGVFNFGHGALATISAYLFYALHVQHGVSWPVAAILCVLVAGPVLGIVLERMARALTGVSLASRVVCTIGILLIVQATAVIIYGTQLTRTVPPFLPTHPYTVEGTVVTADRIIVFAIGLLATAALYIYFRVTRTGVAMRAVVDDAALLDVAGTSPVWVRRWAWIIGVTFASASGVLLVPFITLDSTTLTFLVVAAFGAAALGGFASLPMTYLGGLAIGVGASLCTKWFTSGLLSGASASLPFIVLFVVLLVSPRRRLVERAPVVPRSQAGWTAPWQIQSGAALVVVVLLLLAPSFVGIHLGDYTQFLAITIALLSLGLLVRTSGQVSLCHISFMAIGVCSFSRLTTEHGWPWGFAIVGAGLIAVPIGAVLAIPAIRLSGLYLALATFGFGILLQYMFYSEPYMFGGNGLGITVPRPHWSAIGITGSDRSYYYVCLAFAVFTSIALLGINRGRLGRLLRALADSPMGLATSGTSTHVTRVLVFCISAFVAAIAGALAAGAIGQASGDSYPPITSLLYFAIIIISVGNSPWYALVGAVGVTIIPSYITSAHVTNWLQVVFGAAAILFAVTPEVAKGMPLPLQRLFDLVRRPARRNELAADAQAAVVSEQRRSGSLKIVDIRVAFGGLVAVDGVSVEVTTGKITGLIGPNGAGKTTTFNACSGLNHPSRGIVTLDDRPVTRRGPAARARLGLGRTFQQMQLFDSLTVRENVALGAEAGSAGANPFGHLMSTRSASRRVASRAQSALEQCDLLELADRTAGSLSTGQRRLVELARCLAGSFHILLLDEPSSGLDRVETARFGEIIQRAVRESGVGILLVEHDMALVTDVCDYLYVLDFGRPIFHGSVADAVSSPIVQAAYLGGNDDVEAASRTESDQVRSEVTK